MLHLTTYFDKNYLSRGLILCDSLKANCTEFELYILCLDEDTLVYFQQNKNNYPEVKTLLLADIEGADNELKASKSNRSTIEYYFTLSPCLPLYLLKKYQLPHICSLDADILFSDNPKRLFDYLQDYSIIITPHKFSPEMNFLVQYGIYNVSFQIFKNDDTGVACLEKWRQQCLEWCGDLYDEKNNRFADQKYLDNWMTLYPGKVKELFDNVSGLAPWNLNNFQVEKRDNLYYSNNERLIFYHFHHFKLFGKKWASNGLKGYEAKDQSGVDQLYLDYWNKIEDENQFLGTTKDFSKRMNLSQNLLVKLLNEKWVYYKFSRTKILHVSFQLLPRILKKIILKIYA